MGYVTVAFIHNDRSSDLEDSPKTVAWMLAHPPIGNGINEYWNQVRLVANKNWESMPHCDALRIFPTFHNSNNKIFLVSGNTMVEAEIETIVKHHDGTKSLTIKLPEWFK